MHSLLILAIFVFKYCFPKHKFVYAECAMGEFGENCAGRCYCALGATCNVTSGICPDECEVGFEGEFCHIGKFLLYVAHSIRNIITLCKIMVALVKKTPQIEEVGRQPYNLGFATQQIQVSIESQLIYNNILYFI